MDAHKLVYVRCRCELGKGVSLTVSDQGQGFEPNAIPDPLAVGNLEAEKVSFERGSTEVHMRKESVGTVFATGRGWYAHG
jgi:hypothetical protein